MSFPEYLLSQGIVERLGWMLVHFLWQGAVVALLLAATLRLLPRVGANLRYLVACSALALAVVLPAVTMQWIEVAGPAAEAGPLPLVASPDVTLPPMTMQMAEEMQTFPEATASLETADLTTPIPLHERIAAALEPALPYLVAGWLVGVLGLSAWHLGGWAQLQRLKRRMVRRIGDNLQQRAATLGACLGVRRAVTLLESALVEVPTVVGWLRPAILLPASALTGLSPEQLEAILAHELAHIRRYDYLVNMVQTVVEILGFYHPAVWWVSHRIRIERENCCDDLAVRLCGDSVRYARALTCLEEIRHSQAELAVAATGGSLIERIARLLGRPATDDRRLTWLPGLIALLLIAGIVIPAALVLAASEPPAVLPPATVASDDPQTQTDSTNATEQGMDDTEPNIVRVDFVIGTISPDLTVDRETMVLISEPPTQTGERGNDPNRTASVRVIDAGPHFTAKNGLYTTGPLGVVNRTVDGESKAEAFYLMAKPTVTPAGKADDSPASGPNAPRVDLRTEAAGEPNDAAAERTQVLVKTKIIEAVDNLQLDRETVRQIENILGKPVRVDGRTGKSSRLRLTTGEVLRQHVVQQSLPNEAVQALIDLLTSKGYMNVLAEPQVVAQDGKESQIRAVSNEYFWMGSSTDGSSRSTELQKVEVGTILNVTPHVEDPNNIILDIKVELSHIVPGPRKAVPPAISTRMVTATVTTKSGRHVVLGGMSEGKTPNKAKDSQSVYIIVMPTLITPPERWVAARTEYVNSDPIYQEMAKQIVKVEQQLIADGQKFTSDNPVITPHRRLLDGLRQKLADRKETLEKEFDAARPPDAAQVSVWPGPDPNHPQAGEDTRVDIGIKIATVTDEQRLDFETAIEIENILGRRVRPQGQDGRPGQPLDLTVGDVFQNYIVGQALTEEAVRSLTNLLAPRGHMLKMLASPRVLTRDGVEARIWIGNVYAMPGKDPGKFEEVEIGTKIGVTPRVRDPNVVTLDIAVELSDLAPNSENKDIPLVRRRTNNTAVTTPNDRYFIYPMGKKDASEEGSLYIMVKPIIVESDGAEQSEARAGVPSASVPESRVTAAFNNTDLREALAEISRRGRVSITADETVKPQAVTAELVDASVAESLRQILKGTAYTFTKIGETPNAPREQARVSMVFQGDDLRQVLQDLSYTAGVPILAGETVAGQVYADMKDIPLERALEMVLAGTPYIAKKTPDYYLVATAPRPPGPNDRRIFEEKLNTSPSQRSGYLVYRPISQRIPGDDRAQTLMDLAAAAGISIAVGADVTGTVYADLWDVPLETALRIVTAGTPYVVEKKADHYQVTGQRMPAEMRAPVPSRDDRQAPVAEAPNVPALPVTVTFIDADLRDVLAEISKRAGVRITPDETVKPQTITAHVGGSVQESLGHILRGTPYTFRRIGETMDAQRERARITIAIPGDDLRQVLQDLSILGGVPILADETVVGPVFADIMNIPLESALEMVLTGTPYVVKKTPDYYLVTTDARLPVSKGRRIFEEKPDASRSQQATYLVYRPISLTFTGDDRRQALMDLAATTGISIAVDGRITGKVYTDLQNVPLETAFRIILAGTPYVAVKKADQYEVVLGAAPAEPQTNDPTQPRVDSDGALPASRPITANFEGEELQQVLQDISAMAGVRIVADEDVTGPVWATMKDVSLDKALEIVLAGKPYVVKKYPDFYLVADRKLDGSAFQRISETQRVRLNYITPSAAKGLLSPAFTSYVQAEIDPNSHIVTVTAPHEIATRIVDELKGLDIRPRLVLLDTRIVVMERRELGNLGIEWVREQDAIAPSEMRMGSLPDRLSSDSLVAQLGRLDWEIRADIVSSPQVMAIEGRRSTIQVVGEEYSIAPRSARRIGISLIPRIGDNNDITLSDIVCDINDSVTRGQNADSRMTTPDGPGRSITVRNGGTAVFEGLAEDVPRLSSAKVDPPRVIVTFMTARRVPDRDSGPPRSSQAGESAQVVLKFDDAKSESSLQALGNPDRGIRPGVAVDRSDSRAWTIMRQWNCPPLLLGLTQQFAKVLQPARQNDAMWREAAAGESLRLDVKVEQEEASREIVVGLFKDAKWQEEPVAVRLLPGEGTHTLTGLPAGRYQIGAMIGRAPSAAALGIQRTWPQAIEITPGQTATAELLVSRDFAWNASGWYNQEVSRDYTGDWSLLDQSRLLQGRLTGPDGEPIRFAQVQVREYRGVRTHSIAAPELGTNEDGVYKFDGMKWPYRLGAIWTDPLPSVLGCRYQFKYLNRVFEGPQQVDFRFDRFPQGAARVSGRVVDPGGKPLKGFIVCVRTPEFATMSREGKQSTPDGQTYTGYGYKVPFICEDGRFEIAGLPPGPMLAHAVPFEIDKYRPDSDREVTLDPGQTATVELTVTARDI